jgi:hypothetical protein
MPSEEVDGCDALLDEDTGASKHREDLHVLAYALARSRKR